LPQYPYLLPQCFSLCKHIESTYYFTSIYCGLNCFVHRNSGWIVYIDITLTNFQQKSQNQNNGKMVEMAEMVHFIKRLKLLIICITIITTLPLLGFYLIFIFSLDEKYLGSGTRTSVLLKFLWKLLDRYKKLAWFW
jgi:hypothetical protein